MQKCTVTPARRTSCTGSVQGSRCSLHGAAALVTQLLAALAVALTAEGVGSARTSEHFDFPLRGKVLTLTVYRPTGQARGTIFMGSGDVGWVGLAVDLSEFLSDNGFIVVGINVRQYLGAFTSGRTTLTSREPPSDFAAISRFLAARHLLVHPVVMSGVSEGAGLAVLAGAAAANHQWVQGVVTMGLPPTAELGWRWTDFTSWITKKDSGEPVFRPKEFLPGVAPLPLCMIQSRKDEYVTEADYRLFEQVAKDPKRLVLIDASNHRFTDRREQLQKEYLGCLAWVSEKAPAAR